MNTSSEFYFYCRRKFFYKFYTKPLAKNWTSATNNFCHGYEHICKICFSSCCTRNFFYILVKNFCYQEFVSLIWICLQNLFFNLLYAQISAYEDSSINLIRKFLAKSFSQEFLSSAIFVPGMKIFAKFSDQTIIYENFSTNLIKIYLK